MQLKKRKKRETQTNEWLVDYNKYLEPEVLEKRVIKHLQAI